MTDKPKDQKPFKPEITHTVKPDPIPLSPHAPDGAGKTEEPFVSIPIAAFNKLIERLDKLEIQQGQIAKAGTPDASSAMASGPITPLQKQLPNRDPDNPHDPNPCECDECTPFKVHHWFCTSCQRGPFRFEKTDPGKSPVLLPPFRRQLQKYVTRGYAFDRDGNRYPIQQWVYWARYACSAACAAQEQSQVANDQWDLAAKNPAMQRSVESVNRAIVAQEEALVASHANGGDDLS